MSKKKSYEDYDICNVYTYNYSNKDTKKLVKDRAERGFCNTDAWNYYTWFLTVNAKALRFLADKANGSPVGMKFEEWQSYLREIAQHLENANVDNWENPVQVLELPHTLVENDDGTRTWAVDESEVTEEMKKAHDEDWAAYCEAEKKHDKFANEELLKAFEMLHRHFYSLWD